MDKTLKNLIEISNAVGKDRAMVLGTFGNTSVKTEDGEYMYIKAGGTALKDMSESAGWRRMRVDKVLGIAKDESLKEVPEVSREMQVTNGLLYACRDEMPADVKPSCEACFHSLLDRYVIHVHVGSVLSFACCRSGKQKLEEIFSDEEKKALWVGYARVGFELADKIQKAMVKYVKANGEPAKVLFLQNHGLVISASSRKEAMDLLSDVVKKCEDNLPKIKKASLSAPEPRLIKRVGIGIRAAFKNVCGEYVGVRFFLDEQIETFIKSADAKKMCNGNGVTPDEQVLVGGPAVWLNKTDEASIERQVKKYYEKNGTCPKAFIAEEIGLFIASTEGYEFYADVVESFMKVRQNAMQMGGIKGLTASGAADLYVKPEADKMVLQNRIAVVTGAGSGIGKSIAIGMARAGAFVGLADIDTDAAGQTQAEILSELPEAQTLVITCNVIDEKNVQEGFEKLLEEWGGIDILVNAAGVAPPFSLIDMPVDKWRFALEVNLTGYFLMAKEAATIMKAQGIGGSIINISCKSGLDAIKNNGAYNATKCGELHMARGWALEMGRDNIRFNCVAPGNVFEGSKIWNPEYIKVCAKKYGIKPEEVIPFYVSRSALNREIKGQDIADGVVFLCSDKARRITGQTLVIDAGQVMVR